MEIAAIKQKEQLCKQSDSVHTLVVGSANQERELCYKQIWKSVQYFADASARIKIQSLCDVH